MGSSEVKVDDLLETEYETAPVLVVASGKGGVGKTNMSANIAISLAATGRKVTLMDVDMGLANIDILMSVDCRYNLWHFLSGQKSLSEISCHGPSGVEVICGGSGLTDMADISKFQHQRLIDELEGLRNNCDMLIMDAGAGIGKSVVGFCHAADQVLVVTTPEPTSMTDAYSLIKVLAAQQYSGKVSLLVNMAQSKKEGKQVYRQISSVAMRFLSMTVYEAGVVLMDEKVPASVRSRTPVVLSSPRSKTAAEIRSIAARLARITEVTQKHGFFKKVANWFF